MEEEHIELDLAVSDDLGDSDDDNYYRPEFLEIFTT
jgi:hypothetical protein